MCLVGLYSKVERLRYDARQIKIAKGEIEDDLKVQPTEERPPGCCGKNWLSHTLKNFYRGMTTKVE